MNDTLSTNLSTISNTVDGQRGPNIPSAAPLPAWMTAPRDPAKDAAALGVNAPVASSGASVINGISTPASVTKSVDRRVTPGAPAAPGVSAVPGGPSSVPGASAGPAGAIAGPAQATPGQATTPGATAGPAGASAVPVLPPGPPGSLAQGPAPRPAPGTPGTLAMGMPKWDPATIAQDAPAYAKAVNAWARGHVAAQELRDRWGHDVPSPGAVPQSSQPGAPGAANFSPTVQSLLTRLRAQGWSNAQVPGVGHVIRHPSGKAFVFHPENGSLTPFNSTPSLAQGVVPTAQVG